MKGRRAYIRVTRRVIQAGFVLLTALICVKLYAFVFQFDPSAAQAAAGPLVERPTGVDAFLPIGGFMALKYFVFTGIVEPSHPAAMVFFLAIVLSSMFVKKGFCGWICPVGTLSEYAWMLGEKIFGRNFRIPPKLDIGLRSIKYLLMAAFVFLILVLPAYSMVLFFMQDEYKLMDGRMLLFFMEPSTITITVLATLFGLSLLFKNFWCRYLCPYGALLGILSFLSPFKVRRDEDKCTHCNACTKNCPQLIDVEKKDVVISDECFGCLNCVSHCPEEGALEVTFKPRKKIHVLKKPLMFALALFAVFYLIVGAGAAFGIYKSRLPIAEYEKAVPTILDNRRQPASSQPASSSESESGASESGSDPASSGTSEWSQPSSQSASVSSSSSSSESSYATSSSP